MRRAKKEGRWMGGAPVGYVNRVREDGRKFIAPKAPESAIMQWVFETIVEGIVTTEQIWKEARKRGLKCIKNNFWVAIRNPVYCGKIFIKKFKEEDSRFVAGQHEPLISEGLYYAAQDVLDGKKKKQRTKITVDDRIPLRGFPLCPKCGRLLTGSGSKGRKLWYYYYHCSSACGFRSRADSTNREFVRELKKYIPHPAATELYKQVILEGINSKVRTDRGQKKELLFKIAEFNYRLKKGRDLLLSGDIDGIDFKTIKADCEKQISALEAKLGLMSEETGDIGPALEKAIANVSELDTIWIEATTIKKRQIIGSIFPEKLIFDGENFRTTRVNEAVGLIYRLDAAFRENKNGTSDIFIDLSHQVNLLGLES
jgi:site-specific DNA recombinase